MDGYVGIAVRTVADRIRAVLSEEYVPWGTSIVGGKVDWNTLTEECCYKIQGCEMSDACHAPVGEYAFGMLVVHRLKQGADNDNRTVQEYHPHITAGAVHIRMRNQAGWTPWCKYDSKKSIDDALKDKVSKSGDIMSGDLNLGKALRFTGGVTSAGIWPGQKDTGDPISAQDANLVIGSWFGIAFRDMCNNQVSCGIDARTGNYLTNGKVIAKGGIEGRLIGKADSAGHSDTSGRADNANMLGGQSLSDILGKINAQNTGGIVASSITQNGWVRFANGLIVQWGTIDGLSSVNKVYAFPIEFPTQAFTVMGASISYEYGVALRTFSRAQFTASWWPDELDTPQNGHPVQFIAIGH